MRTARTSLVVSALSIAITAIGFANQLVIARTFGASRAFDEFLQATSLPLLVSGVVGGVFAYAMVPALVRATAASEHPERANAAFLLAISVIAVCVGALGVGTAPWTLRLFAAKTANPSTSLMISIARVAWVGTAASVVVGFAGAVLNARSSFVLPVVVSAFPYLGMLIAMLVAGREFGVMALVWGLVVGSILCALLLLAASRRNFTFRALARTHFVHVRSFMANAPLAVLSTLTFSVYQAVDSYWAPSLGPSNLSVLGYCQRMLIALGAVMAAGPSVILQPRLAVAAARADETSFISDLGRALRLTILICAPAAAGISLLAQPIIRFAFERGAFTRAATLAVASILPWMLAGMVPMVYTVMLFKALYAKADTRTATFLGVCGPLLYFGGSGLFIRFFGLSGIGLAYFMTWMVLAVIGTLRISARASDMVLQSPFLREFAVVLAGTAVPAYVLRTTLLRDWGSLSTPSLTLRLAVAAIVGVGSYLGVALLIARVADLRLLARGLWRSSST